VSEQENQSHQHDFEIEALLHKVSLFDFGVVVANSQVMGHEVLGPVYTWRALTGVKLNNN